MLIALGFVFFAVAAPLIVLFVRGLKYDFKEKKFVATGIISVRTQPDDAEIYLDGVLAKTSSGELRFLDAKNYLVNARKPGYFDWTKNLRVENNKVTLANPANNKIYLLLKEQSPETILKNVLDFILWPNGSAAISGNSLLVSGAQDLANPKTAPLPKTVSKIQASPDYQIFLLLQEPGQNQNAQVLWYDRKSEKLLDLESLFQSPKNLPVFYFSQNNRLFARIDNALYEINPENSSKQLILPKIMAVQVSGQTIYSLTQEAEGGKLSSLSLETGIKQVLAADVPKFDTASIFINAQKRIFLASHNKLYAFSTQGLSLIAENITNLTADNPNNPMAFLSSGELRFLDEQNKNFLVTRLSEDIKLQAIHKPIGYAFFIKNSVLTALELDQSHPQNSYPIYRGKNILKYFADEEVKNMLILDEGELKKIRIR
mgnify:CR=1 FL=1